ncbi:MAG: phosphodiesterase [Hamadaea sp.]|nr:phosphodiesterase [Hamadaea sp.]
MKRPRRCHDGEVPDHGRTPKPRVGLRDVRDALLGLVPTAAALLLASWLVDGFTLTPWWTAVVLAAATAVVDALARPVLRLLAGRAGVVTALAAGVAVQLAVIWLAVLAVPGASLNGIGAAIATLIVVALVLAVTRWLVGVNDSSYLVTDLIRRGERRRAAAGAADGGAEGVVIVQIDGLPHPVLRFGVLSGDLPTLARWVRGGGHDLRRWWARVPSTTPASQAALLHGTNEGICAFRWYDKDLGRLVVTNRPADAAEVEAGLSDGRGLLADGGVSVSNMFSGDASTSLMVMSRASGRRGLGPGRDYLRFFASPFVLVRALALTVGEMVKELYQGRQQRLRGVEPRVDRRGSYVLLRGATNAILRDLNVALVAEHMMAGAPVIYVDFVDYDEIAHHAGVARPESLAALQGVDRVLGTLEKVAAAAPRAYRFVVLSDHGQSQGATFLQLTGHTLEQAVRRSIGAAKDTSIDETAAVEAWGPVNAMLTELLGASKTTARWTTRHERPSAGAGMLVGPGRDTGEQPETPELVVAGSGNLGLVWFPRLPGRVSLDVLERTYPALIPNLLAEPGVGFVVVDSSRGPLAIGSAGVHVLREGVIEGADPLLPFGPRAAADLARVAAMTTAPDVYVHSSLDPRTGEVHAFEELVGCHGGLGGWQNEACLVHPADWPLDDDLLDRSVDGEEVLYGADVVHRQLVRWLERCGVRKASDPS